jgi:hypothetical protein
VRYPPNLCLAPLIKTRKNSKCQINSIPFKPKAIIQPKERCEERIPKPREEVFVCMFCGRADHLDEFCLRRKRIERMCVEYARNSYCDEFFDLSSHSYSRVPPRSYSRDSFRTFSRALHRTSSCALPQFTHAPNHCSYGLGS